MRVFVVRGFESQVNKRRRLEEFVASLGECLDTFFAEESGNSAVMSFSERSLETIYENFMNARQIIEIEAQLLASEADVSR